MIGDGLLRHQCHRLRLPRHREASPGSCCPVGRWADQCAGPERVHSGGTPQGQRSWPEIEAAIAVLRIRFPEVIPITSDTHVAAIAVARDHGLSFYDALIVSSALEAGCDRLYSEDLLEGRRFPGLTILNPFAN